MKAARANLVTDQRGAVYVEFILAFMPLFLMFLAIFQAAMIYTANLLVHEAATSAARSAAVIINDDPANYATNPPVGTLTPGASTPTVLNSFLTWAGFPVAGGGGPLPSRLQAIRTAAVRPLLPLGPPQGSWFNFGAVMSALAVSFPETARAANGAWAQPRSLQQPFAPNEDIIVRVSYLYQCRVPVVSRVSLGTGADGAPILGLCKTLSALLGVHPHLAADFQQGGEIAPTALPSGNYVLIRAEATFPNQGAAYAYGQRGPPL